MKKILLLIPLLAILLMPLSAQAFDQRTGDFRLKYDGAKTWFSKDNVFSPGETKSKDFWAHNYSTNPQELYFIVNRKGGNTYLTDQLIVKIYREGNLIFQKKLTEISQSARNQESLGIIDPNTAKRYTFSIYLKKNLGNEWQNKESGKVVFSLGFGVPGRAPTSLFTVFGTVGDEGATDEGEIAGTTTDQEKADRSELEAGEIQDEEEDGDVKGAEKTGWLGSCGSFSWLIIILILVILALIIWRYWLNRRKEE